MAVTALGPQRLVAHHCAAVFQLIRAVARRAFETGVRPIELESRIGLMVERKTGETIRDAVATGAIHCACSTELSEVRVLVTGLAIATERPAECASQLIRFARPGVALCALHLGMGAGERIAGPKLVIELRDKCVEARGGVTAKTVGPSVDVGGGSSAVECAPVNIVVTLTAIAWRAMKDPRRDGKFVNDFRDLFRVAVLAGDGFVCTSKRETRLRMLGERKRCGAKAVFLVAGGAVLVPKQPNLKLTEMRVRMAFAARRWGTGEVVNAGLLVGAAAHCHRLGMALSAGDPLMRCRQREAGRRVMRERELDRMKTVFEVAD